jgi:UDP-N-acetyl-D-glucosamine dehydrogenase
MTNISTSPLTGVSYDIPDGENNSSQIDAFIEKHKDKPVVVVQGLGFVGAVMSLVCANALKGDYAVIGVDLPTAESYWRIRSLNDGVFPVTAEDPQIDDFFQKSRNRGNFLATHDPYAYSVADIIVVDINLDVQKVAEPHGSLVSYDVDLSGFRAAMRVIGQNCRDDVLVLVETTVPPGTCEMIAKPLIQEELVRRGLRSDRLKLGHSYERVMPGPNYIESITTFPRVYSGSDGESADATEHFLKTIIDTDRCPLTRLSSTNASEMAKVLENAYRAMNIAFMVEWSRFAEEAGVDLYSVVNAIRVRPTHANLMFPGIGVGGYCLTKDPLLASWSRRTLFGGSAGLGQSEMAVRINDQMPVYAYQLLFQHVGDLRGLRVLLLGVSYRGEVGDTRSSPVSLFYDCLISAGAEVSLHDPYVPYWSEKDRKVSPFLTSATIKGHDVVVIATGHRFYAEAETIEILLGAEPLLVFDTVGLLRQEQLDRLGQKHTVKVLGRGDR